MTESEQLEAISLIEHIEQKLDEIILRIDNLIAKMREKREKRHLASPS